MGAVPTSHWGTEPSETGQYPIILSSLDRWYKEFLTPICQRHHMTLEPQLVIRSYETIKRLVRAGLGIALVPRVVCQDEQPGTGGAVATIPIDPPIQRETAWIQQRNRTRSAACDEFFEFLTTGLPSQPGCP